MTAGRRRALDHEEPLIFELGAPGRTGVDLPEPEPFRDRLGDLGPRREIGLPRLAAPPGALPRARPPAPRPGAPANPGVREAGPGGAPPRPAGLRRLR